jgi:hypothetical protein
MSHDTEYDALDIDQLNEESESEVVTEHDEIDEDENESDELRKLRSENAKLVDIIKRRKERENQSKASQTINSPSPANTPTREEIFLVAQGFNEDDLQQLNALAKGLGTSLNEAKENPLFQAYLEKKEKDKRDKKAQLGASKGSNIKKPVELSGLNKEDHLKIWKEKVGME